MSKTGRRYGKNLLSNFLHDPDTKMILVIFFPIFVDMILNNLISTVHSYFVAGVGEAAISGIGLVGNINNIISVVFTCLPSAATILVSQYRGAQNPDGARRCVSQSMAMVVLFSSAVCAVMLLFPQQLFNLFFSKTAPDVLEEGLKYMSCMALSLPFYGIFQTGACVCRGYGNNKIPLFVSVSGSVINVVLAYVFIVLLDYGVVGAGIALIVSRAYTAILASILLAKNGWFAAFGEFIHIDWHTLGAIVKLGILSSSESLIVQFGATMKTRFIVEAGTAHLAANSIHGTLFGLTGVPITAMGTVAITLVGRYIGSGDKEETKSVLGKIIRLTIGMYAVMMTAAFFVFPYVYPLYTENPETLGLLRTMLYIHIPMMLLANPFVSIITNAFKGAGDATSCTVVSVVCMWVVNVGLGVFLASQRFLGLGVIGSLISGNASICVKGIIYFLRYRTDKWMKKRLV